MLQDNVEDNVASIATPIENLLQDFQEVFHNHDPHGIMVAIIKITQEFEHELVRLALDLLELVVLGFDFLEVDAFPEFLDKEHDTVAGLIEERKVLGEVAIVDLSARNH